MKEDDMDEMLRRAAANYEVDAGKAADWNAVFKAVHSTEEEFVPAEDKKKRRRFMFWWLLLIPLGWIANTMYNKFNEADKTKPKTSVQVEAKSENRGGSHDRSYSQDDAAKRNTITGNNQDIKKNLSGKTVRPNKNSVLAETHAGQNSGTRNGLFEPQLSTTGSENASQQPIEQQQENILQSNSENAGASATRPNINSPTLQQKDISSASGTDTAQKQNNVARASKSPVKIRPAKSNHFYAGLIAGMDLSFVKYQQMEPLGYNAGLLVGYKFRKLSVESGLYFVKKNYYTGGEHFDKSGIPYFNDAEILTVDGYCQMFEIPLNIKYNLAEKKNHAWFITAGLSSYLMNKEYYNYDYMKDGEERYGSRAYYHATQNWFSVFNLSAGYELKTNTKTNLRIEPYFKAPLSGVGTGKLSISSVGINAGIVRQIP